MQYEVRVTDMDIGIACYYQHKYDEAIEHYIRYMKEDPQSMKEIEYNVFDALLQKSRWKSDSVRK